MNHEHEIWMRRALSLAAQGQGRVEPNPMVGCVMVRDGELIGQGFHRQFGQAHAEVDAINDAKQRGHDPRGATAYVTLEPCSHYGKTPPCCLALIEAQVRRVVVATTDPSPHAAGQGIHQLQTAGIDVHVGVLEEESQTLLAPFLKRLQTGLPWVIAKWAMSLDGKMATRTGHSQWISGPPARALVHQLRGRMDGIMVGIGTALADDPALTARLENGKPPARVATRIVVDRHLRLPLESQLVRTAREVPVLVACESGADANHRRQLESAGVKVWATSAENREFDYAAFVRTLLAELSSRGMTNILVEGGASLLGNLFDQDLVDEQYVFVAPIIIGGTNAISPVGGLGRETVPHAGSGRAKSRRVSHQVMGNDVLIHVV
ncbi:MAG: bifunctional diaminohydroxyphosphoribosylaminopyrimidine deaminase/5-amino-6-(5-phosphoribosylamino)uracil reductase RibD [Planctomycetaceae bacterium]|nr:bifunctional diaminohydroxyphosphoribosylaminopyrimidine deaminase/5-amino-6-(5-phosphoribosylamino)uracil reductase RibD [Planctomycetaceae bacterium]